MRRIDAVVGISCWLLLSAQAPGAKLPTITVAAPLFAQEGMGLVFPDWVGWVAIVWLVISTLTPPAAAFAATVGVRTPWEGRRISVVLGGALVGWLTTFLVTAVGTAVGTAVAQRTIFLGSLIVAPLTGCFTAYFTTRLLRR
jgi:hypothetical protein